MDYVYFLKKAPTGIKVFQNPIAAYPLRADRRRLIVKQKSWCESLLGYIFIGKRCEPCHDFVSGGSSVLEGHTPFALEGNE